MDGLVDVRTTLPVDQYKQLAAIATQHHTTVGALVAELTRRALARPPMGRRAKYTPELGERITLARWLHRSWEEIGKAERINSETAKHYAARFEAAQKSTTTKGKAA